MRLIFLLVLIVVYFGLDKGLTIWFTRRFSKPDNFIGERAPDEVQRFFGRVVYLGMAYYVQYATYKQTAGRFFPRLLRDRS